MRIVAATITASIAITPAAAQFAPPPNTITIAASGRIETRPDIANLSLSIRGEGATPDAATTALATKQRAILAGLQQLDRRMTMRTSAVSMREIRTGRCPGGMLPMPNAVVSLDAVADSLETAADMMDAGNDGSSSKGPCKIIGTLAEISADVMLAAVEQTGTAIGLASRLGAANAQLDGFGLRDPAAATRRAIADAIVNARGDAQTIAAASGTILGPLISVTNADQGRRVVSAYDMEQTSYNMALPAAAPPPVVLDVKPKPVETTAQLIVTFGLTK
jgi:uncharacterized protein YggE